MVVSLALLCRDVLRVCFCSVQMFYVYGWALYRCFTCASWVYADVLSICITTLAQAHPPSQCLHYIHKTGALWSVLYMTGPDNTVPVTANRIKPYETLQVLISIL